MESSPDAPRHRLVHVRGGPLMLFTSLCISLPQDAQHLLSVLLWLVPSLLLLKVPTIATAFMKRVVEPLFVKALSEVVGSHQAMSPWRANLHTSQLLSKAVHLMVTYLAGTNLARLVATAPSLINKQSPSDHLASLSDAALCERVLTVVTSASPAPLPASLRSLASEVGGRVCASLFSTTTAIALRSYAQYVLAQTALDPATLYVPGLLTAPWTTHVVPLLHDLQRQYGARVVGYDVVVDAHGYEVDMEHLRTLDEARRRSRRAPTQSGRSKARPAENASPSSTAETAVLILASVRGRCVHNRDRAFELAKSRGWQVVELCVPTLPPDAASTEEPLALSRLLQAQSAPPLGSIVAPRPDVRITAFDDVGMHGGAVVHLCVNDGGLLAHMKSECEVGLPGRGLVGVHNTEFTVTAPTMASRRVDSVALRAIPSTALTTTITDLTARSSEYLTHVWLPWASRLYVALRDEGGTVLQVRRRIHHGFAASNRFLTQTLPSLSIALQHNVARLLSACPVRSEAHVAAAAADSDGADASNNGAETSAHLITAETPVEQRTTVITQPLPPLDVELSPASLKDETATPAEKQWRQHAEGEENQPLPLASMDGAVRDGGNALTSWMSRLTKLEATTPMMDTEVIRNTAAEWRIRLRWTALLLATYSEAIAGPPPASTRKSSCNDVCVAAYVSLWSFIVQLPPWVVAVSVDSEVDTADGVEVAATAVLLRVASPATPRAVAQLLCDEAAVDARAMSMRAWEEVRAGPASAAKARAFDFEDGLAMPGCPRAAAVVGELLYVPLTPAMPAEARAAVLRVLWDRVPHAVDAAAKTARRGSAAPPRVVRALSDLYRSYLPHAPPGVSSNSDGDKQRFRFRPLQPRHADAGVSDIDAVQAQRVIFRSAQSMAAASAAPPSFVTDAAASLVAPLKNTIVDKLLSKL